MSIQRITTPALPWRSHRAKRSPRGGGGDHGRALNANDVRAIAACALRDSKNGRASDHWRGQLEGIDRTACFSGSALRLFQDLQARLGLRTGRPILLPLSAQPFWHRMHHPFANYQSTASLSRAADVVIIGAGLTGAAAAHRLKDTGLKIVLLDPPARQAVATAAVSSCCRKIPSEPTKASPQAALRSCSSVIRRCRRRSCERSVSDRPLWCSGSRFAIVASSKRRYSGRESPATSRREVG
jgi:hypothetical protein